MEKYVKITLLGGSSYIQPLKELRNAIDGEIDGLEECGKITLTFEMVSMTKKDYEELPDFSGH